jgi:hypothetical protein
MLFHHNTDTSEDYPHNVPVPSRVLRAGPFVNMF